MEPIDKRSVQMQQTINFHEVKNQKFAKLLDDLQIAVFKKRIVEVMPRPEEVIRAKYQAITNPFLPKKSEDQSSQEPSSHIVKSIVSDDDDRLSFKFPKHKTS